MKYQPRYSPRDLVTVKWRDALCYTRYVALGALRKPLEVERFTAHVVEDREDELVLSIDDVELPHNDSTVFATVWRIPKGCILSITRGTFKPDKR